MNDIIQESEKLHSTEKNNLHFKGRHASRAGITSLVLGIVVWAVFLVLSIYSSQEKGDAPDFIGALGIVDAMFCLLGIYNSVRGFQERDVFYGLPIAGLVLNALLFLVYFCLYLMGAVI